MNQKFDIVCKCTCCLYSLLKHYVKKKSRYLEFKFRLKYFLSLWSWGLVGPVNQMLPCKVHEIKLSGVHAALPPPEHILYLTQCF